MKDADLNADGKVSLPEVLKIVSDSIYSKEEDEELVELFKSFGALDVHDVITEGKLDNALRAGGEILQPAELTLIYEELAGASKRLAMPADRRYMRAAGMTFNDFLLMLLAK